VKLIAKRARAKRSRPCSICTTLDSRGLRGIRTSAKAATSARRNTTGEPRIREDDHGQNPQRATSRQGNQRWTRQSPDRPPSPQTLSVWHALNHQGNSVRR
jgi:hypothetical protein